MLLRDFGAEHHAGALAEDSRVLRDAFTGHGAAEGTRSARPCSCLPGTIVSVGSITAQAGSPMQAAYGAAKAGLASLARSVAAEYSREGIRMNIVSCGPIATPVARRAQTGAAEWIPLGRPGESREVADAAVFLASPLSSYVSGQSLVIDGGATAVGPFRVSD